jgi:hypothetical protein
MPPVNCPPNFRLTGKNTGPTKQAARNPRNLWSTQPDNTLTFTVKMDGKPVIPDNMEVSRNGDEKSGITSVSIDLLL